MSSQNTHGSQAYLKTKVMTASPAELRLMLIDGAIRFADQAKRGYEERDFERAYEGTTKAQNILMELLNALRPDQSPELCARLSALYTYMYKSLVEASSTRDTAKVDEVIELLRFERETWRMCLDEISRELARENQTAAGMRVTPSVNPTHAMPSAAAPNAGQGGAPRGSLSISG
jgi:flagellar protein FliS